MDEPAEPRKFRVTLADLLAVTAVIAMAVAPMRWMGGVYAVSGAVSLALLGVLVVLLYRRKSLLSTLPCGLAAFLSLPLFSTGLLWQAVLSWLICLATVRIANRVRWRIAACAATLPIAYAGMISSAIERDREVVRLREQWPLVSVRDRLPPHDGRGSIERVRLTPEQSERLEQLQAHSGRGGLQVNLMRLHDDAYRRFARAPGFGFSRMGPVTERALARHDNERRASEETTPLAIGASASGPTAVEVHVAFQTTFLSTSRTGYAEDIDRVAGFVGHGIGDVFREEPRWVFNGLKVTPLREADPPEAPGGRWIVERLDLIGLVLHDQPIAYVSDRLPNMQELREAPTRELDDFEAAAVERLRGQEDIVAGDPTDAGHVAMVGAIRAADSCMACHQTDRGVLLGAFSYDLIDRATVALD